MSSARFKIRNQTTNGAWSPFSDEGFDCAPGDVLELQLEDTPALDISLTIFSDVDHSTGRSAIVLSPVTGEAATPTSIVTATMPNEYGSWQIQCQVNGGVDVLDSAGRPDATVNTKSRIVAIRTAVLQLRHPLAVELTAEEPYDPARIAGTIQEAIDALEAGAGAGGASSAAHYLVDALAAINTNDVPIRALASALGFVLALASDSATADVLDVCRDTVGNGANGDGARLRLRISNAGHVMTTAAAVSTAWTDVTILGGPRSSLLFWTTGGGTLSTWMTLAYNGALRLHGAAYASAGGRPITDVNGNLTLAAISEAEARSALAGATASIAVNSQKITGLANGSASDDAAAFGQIAAGFAGVTLTGTSPITVAGDNAAHDLSANRTIAFSVGADVPWNGHGITGIASVANAGGALSLSSGTGDATLDADSGHTAKLGASTAGGVQIGHSGKTTTISSSSEVHEIDDDKEIDSRWGSAGFTVHRRKSVTTVNNTPVAAFTFSIPSSATGHVVLRVNAVDVTNNDSAFYEKRYRFSRRSGGTSTFANVGTDIDAEDDATWQAEVTHSSPTLSAMVTGDSANQTQFDVEWWVRYETFSPV